MILHLKDVYWTEEGRTSVDAMARSERRYTVGRSGRFERWFSDLVGGAPTLSSTTDPEGRQAH